MLRRRVGHSHNSSALKFGLPCTQQQRPHASIHPIMASPTRGCRGSSHQTSGRYGNDPYPFAATPCLMLRRMFSRTIHTFQSTLRMLVAYPLVPRTTGCGVCRVLNTISSFRNIHRKQLSCPNPVKPKKNRCFT